jgi:hypothetical protein
MFKILAEQPILMSFVLGILAFGLFYSWTRASQKWMLQAGFVILLLIPLVWLAAGLIETEDERIRLMIGEFAERVEANDVEGALASIHPTRPDVRQRAAAELPNYEFTRARVGGYQTIRVLPEKSPPQAVVDLIAAVTVSVRSSGFEDQRVSRRLLLLLEKVDDQWMVLDYAHRAPVGARDAFATPEKDWERLLNPRSATGPAQ